MIHQNEIFKKLPVSHVFPQFALPSFTHTCYRPTLEQLSMRLLTQHYCWIFLMYQLCLIVACMHPPDISLRKSTPGSWRRNRQPVAKPEAIGGSLPARRTSWRPSIGRRVSSMRASSVVTRNSTFECSTEERREEVRSTESFNVIQDERIDTGFVSTFAIRQR